MKKEIQKEIMKQKIKKTLAWIGIVTVGILMYCAVFFMDCYNYNKGVCRTCNGHYEFFDVERTRNSLPEYYYKCDNCDDIVRTLLQY